MRYFGILTAILIVAAGCTDPKSRGSASDDSGGGGVAGGAGEAGEAGAGGGDELGGQEAAAEGDGHAEGEGGEGGGAEGGNVEGGTEGAEGGEGGADPPCQRPEHCDRGQTCDRGECVDIECESEGDCQGGVVCGDGLCKTLGRVCLGAADNPVFVGITTNSDRSGGGSNLDADCAGTGLARESVHGWQVQREDQDFVLSIETDGFAPVISILSDCENPTTVFCQVFEGGASRVALPQMASGSYWVVVDGHNDETPDNRRFQLTISEAPTADTPGGDTCPEAADVEFDDDGRAQLSGDLIAASNDSDTCQSRAGAADWFYRFRVPADAGLAVTVQSADDRTAWELRGADCEIGPQVSCRRSPGSMTFGRLPAGVYHLGVDGSSDFLIDLVLTDAPATPSNDSCASPRRIRLDEDGESVIPGDTSIATDSRSPACGLAEGPELTYRIDLPATQRLRAQLRSDWGGVLSVRETCGGDDADLLCELAPAAVQVQAAPEDRTIHLVVDSDNGVGGPFELVVQSLPPAAGDTCDDPILLRPAGAGLWLAEGSTIGQGDDYLEPCGDFGVDTGPDVFVAFEVEEEGNFFFGLQAGFDATLHLVEEACDAGRRVDCNDDAPEPELQSAITARGLQPGPYWIVVDGLGPQQQGPFTLTVERLEPPANGVCADGAPIDIDAESGVGRIAGSLRVAADQSLASCAEAGWGEVWFTVDLAEASSLRLRTAPGGGQAAVGVGVFDGGCGQAELGCALIRPDQGALFMPEVGPGTIPIVVEGTDTATFELVVQVGPAARPPDNESCETAEEIVFDEDGEAVVTGQIIRAADDHEPVCGGVGPDAAYVFELEEERQVRLIRTPAIGDSDLFVSAWGAGCEGDALACVVLTPDSNDSTRLAGAIGPGQVWLVVEGGDGADLGFELTLELDEPIEVPPNDQCGGAITIEFDVEADDPDPVEIQGNTELAQNDYEASCAAGAGSPDVVYEIELVRPGSLDVTMVAGPGADGGLNWDNALYLRRGECHEEEAELLCNDDNPGIGSSRITQRLAEPGTYYIFADGYADDNAGAFTLTVDVGPEPRCPDGEEIVIPDEDDPDPIEIEGTTEGEDDSVNASCASNARSPDLMYWFTLDRPRPLTVVMDAVGGWDNALHLRGEPCVSEQAELACNDDAPGVGRSELILELLQPGIYYLFADGYAAAASGEFTMSVDFGPPPAPPANDSCEAPDALVFEAPAVRVDFELATAVADAAVCGEEEVDVFWAYIPEDDGPFSFAATTSSGALSVGAECGEADLACLTGAILPDALGPQNVWVSGPSDAEGQLVAILGPPAVVLEAGADCESAMALPANGTVAIIGTMQGAGDAVDHADPVCPAAGGGADRVFGMFLQAPANIRADVVAADFEPHIWLRTGGCDNGLLAGCGTARGGWATLDEDVGEGLLTLVVDSLAEEAGGEFLLVLTVTPAEQPPD